MDIPLREYYLLLAAYLQPLRRRIVLLGVLLLGGIALQLAGPQILRSFIDAARSGQSQDVLLASALAYLVVALLDQVLGVAAGYVGQWVSLTATNRLRADLAAHCLDLDLSFHNRRTPGEMIQRIDGDVSALANFFSNLAVLVAGNLLLLAAVLFLLWREEWRLGLAMTLWALLAVYALNRVRQFAVPYFKANRQQRAEYSGFLEERLGGMDDIRANGAVPYALRSLARHWQRIFQTERRARMAGQAGLNVFVASFVLGNVMALGLGAMLFFRGDISLGTVYLVFAYVNLLMVPLRQLSDQLQDLQSAGASIARIRELFGERSRIADPAAMGGVPAPLPPGPLSVEFDRVRFAYSEGPDVLEDVSFRLEPGRVLGVLGRTGSGKTTLTRLLFRLYDPSAGSIRLGGADLRTAALAEVRGRVAMVTQEVQLFDASLRDNLTLFDPSIPDDRLLEVLQLLGLAPWFRDLPAGLDTLLAGGADLSSGQAQLLAFGRVFLSDPGVVILDEASSRLDPATERLMERAVDRLLADRTAIVVAHRLGTVGRADEIMIVEGGRIAEHGPRASLAADPASRFHHLLQSGLEEVLA